MPCRDQPCPDYFRSQNSKSYPTPPRGHRIEAFHEPPIVPIRRPFPQPRVPTDDLGVDPRGQRLEPAGGVTHQFPSLTGRRRRPDPRHGACEASLPRKTSQRPQPASDTDAPRALAYEAACGKQRVEVPGTEEREMALVEQRERSVTARAGRLRDAQQRAEIRLAVGCDQPEGAPRPEDSMGLRKVPAGMADVLEQVLLDDQVERCPRIRDVLQRPGHDVEALTRGRIVGGERGGVHTRDIEPRVAEGRQQESERAAHLEHPERPRRWHAIQQKIRLA